jgi:ubiquinone/menaquinone biosynthesis C-methylase UbiE
MSWDRVWEKVFQEHEWGKYPEIDFVRFIARNFYQKDRKSVKLLEIGCGPGAHIWYMAREGFDTSGIDGSATAIKRAKIRLESEGLKADLRVGDIEHLPWEDGTFDAVADNECLAHNNKEALKMILKEARRVLKAQGLFYSRTFSDEVYKGKTYQKLSDMEYNTSSDGLFAGRGFFRVSNEESIRALYGSQFNILSLDKLDYTINNGAIRISEWAVVCQK